MTGKLFSSIAELFFGKVKFCKVLAYLVVAAFLFLPGLVLAEEVCYQNLQVCVQKPDNQAYYIYQAPADMTYDEVIVNGGLLLRAESKEDGKFLNFSVVKADMTDQYREDFYKGYVFGSVKSKEELGRLVVRKKTMEVGGSIVTTFDEIGRVNQLAYTAKHKIQLKGNFIYTLTAGQVTTEAKALEEEGELIRFLDSVRYLQP